MALSPINNPGAYLDLRVGGRSFPGKIVKGGVRGLGNEEEWSTVRPIAGSGWVQNHKGRQPVKGIEIEVSLDAATKEEADARWQAHYKFVVFIRGKKPPLPFKPPALEATGAPFKGSGVLKVVYRGHVEPIFDTGPNRVIYKFDEATKSTPIAVGPPEAAILAEDNPRPRSLQEAALAAAAATSFGTAPGAPTFATISERYPGVGAVGGTPQ